jgi:hypothetical protein
VAYNSQVPAETTAVPKTRKRRRTLEEQLAYLQRRAYVAGIRVAQLQAAAASKERKADTRRKLILGSALTELMRHDESLRVRIAPSLDAHVALRPRDAGLFDGFLAQLDQPSPKRPADAVKAVQERKRAEHRVIILGGILIELMRTDARLRARLVAALEASFATSKRDAAVFGMPGPDNFFVRLAAPAEPLKSPLSKLPGVRRAGNTRDARSGDCAPSPSE